MEIKSKALKRLNILYGIFFSLIIAALAFSIGSHEFRTGFQEGFSDGMHYGQNSDYRVSRFPNVVLERKAGIYDIPVIEQSDSSLIVQARICAVDIQSESFKESANYESPVLPTLLISMASCCYIGVFIIIFIILTSLRASIKQGNVFSRNNIKRTRAIGILLIVISITINISHYLEIGYVSGLLAGSTLQVSVEPPFLSDLITGILILFIAEIFAIGYDLTEEQKLTI